MEDPVSLTFDWKIAVPSPKLYGLGGNRIQEGQTITPNDALLAKLIAKGRTGAGVGRLFVALKAFAIQGADELRC